MEWKTEIKEEQAFLREQVHQVERKITRIDSAMSACDDCLEVEGLQRSLHNLEVERDLLLDLLQDQLDREAVSLESLIMERGSAFNRDEARLAMHWHRGQPTPPAYWDVEIKRAVLADLLRRYHAWHAGRPYYAQPDSVNGKANGVSTDQPEQDEHKGHYVHPWFIDPSNQPGPGATPPHHEPGKNRSHDALEAIHADLVAALEKGGIPADHFDLIVQPDGQVIVTGYVHGDDQRIDALAAIIMVEDVTELLTDVKIVAPDDCPVCHPEKYPPEQPQNSDNNGQ